MVKNGKEWKTTSGLRWCWPAEGECELTQKTRLLENQEFRSEHAGFAVVFRYSSEGVKSAAGLQR